MVEVLWADLVSEDEYLKQKDAQNSLLLLLWFGRLCSEYLVCFDIEEERFWR